MYYVISCTIITVIIYTLYTRCNNWMSILAQTFIKWLINVSSKFMTRHNQELYLIQKYSTKNCFILIVLQLSYIYIYIYTYIYTYIKIWYKYEREYKCYCKWVQHEWQTINIFDTNQLYKQSLLSKMPYGQLIGTTCCVVLSVNHVSDERFESSIIFSFHHTLCK